MLVVKNPNRFNMEEEGCKRKPERDKQTCRYIHGFKKTFSRVFFSFVTDNAVPYEDSSVRG